MTAGERSSMAHRLIDAREHERIASKDSATRMATHESSATLSSTRIPSTSRQLSEPTRVRLYDEVRNMLERGEHAQSPTPPSK